MSSDLKTELKQALFPLYKEGFSSFSDEELESLSCFCMQWGCQYEKEKGLLFIGKAVNGWTKAVDVETLFSETDNGAFNNADQMEWVKTDGINSDGYNTNRSAFWRIIKAISSERFHSEDFQKYIAWSNLYKFAPYEGGNPSFASRQKQHKVCKEILETEIRILKPKAVILFTSDWGGDLFDLNEDTKINLDKEKVSWGQYYTDLHFKDNTYYIWSYHPQGKVEEPHAKVILELLDYIDKEKMK